MNTNTPTVRTPVEQWLAGLGLDAVEVGRCPVPGCEVCGPPLLVVAA